MVRCGNRIKLPSPSSFRKYSNCLIILTLILCLYPTGKEKGVYPSHTPKPLLQNPPCLCYPATAAKQQAGTLYAREHLYDLLQAIGVPNTQLQALCNDESSFTHNELCEEELLGKQTRFLLMSLCKTWHWPNTNISSDGIPKHTRIWQARFGLKNTADSLKNSWQEENGTNSPNLQHSFHSL